MLIIDCRGGSCNRVVSKSEFARKAGEMPRVLCVKLSSCFQVQANAPAGSRIRGLYVAAILQVPLLLLCSAHIATHGYFWQSQKTVARGNCPSTERA